MSWILAVVVQIAAIALGVRREQRSGRWSWSKFFFALAFGVLECIIITVPFLVIDQHSSYFGAVLIAAVIIAALNFIWMVLVARRWKLPDGRTSLQAYRDRKG
ncbi:hypothetical protein DYQ86_15640 [Acidobacteria bacterium AB60]|nr:hypothetical protein DYQ86_15640 [Acidobacteria bacterium AB60]